MVINDEEHYTENILDLFYNKIAERSKTPEASWLSFKHV